MKNILAIIALSSSLATVMAQDIATLNGKITNPTGDKVFVTQTVGEGRAAKREVLDSAVLTTDGSFNMDFTLKSVTELSFSDGNESCPFILSPGDEVYMALNTKMFDETIIYSGKGAAKNNAVKNLNLMNEVAMNGIFAFDDDADTNKIYAFMDNSFAGITDIVKDYQNELPDFKAYGDKKISDLENVKMQIKAQISSMREFNAMVQILAGTEGIDIKGIDLKENGVNLSEYKGKTIVIDFWATWCGPCKREMPSFKALEEKYGKEVNFVSIAVWCEKPGWIEMANDLGFENNMFLARGEETQVKDWELKFIPRYVVIDKNFKVVDAHAPVPSSGGLEALIKELNPQI